MAYNETYVSGDMSTIVIDFLSTGMAAIVGFASLVALVLVYRWFTGRKK